MRNLFQNIDTTKQFLLLGDIYHDREETEISIFSESFFDLAAIHGYKKLLIELEHNSREAKSLIEQAKPLAAKRGIEIIGVDGRTEEEKKKSSRKLRADVKALEILSARNEVTDRVRQHFRDRFQAALDEADAKDTQTLRNIIDEAGNDKSIVLFGGAHFRLGTPIEQGIPVENREIVDLYPEEALYYEHKKVRETRPADTRVYALDTQEFIEEPETRTADVSKRVGGSRGHVRRKIL